MKEKIYICSDKTLVIDPALTSGFCTVEHYQEIGKELSYENNCFSGYSVVKNPRVYTCPAFSEGGDLTGKICANIFEYFEKILLAEQKPYTRLAIEQYVFSRGKKTGSTLNVSIRTALIMLCQKYSLPYVIIPISLWKKSVSGRAFPTKEQKALWKTKANKLFITEALTKQYGIKIPEKIKSQKTGRLVNFKCDISDAIGQAICLCKKTYGEEIYFDIQWED